MSVRKDPRSPYYTYEFQLQNRRFFGSTKRTNEKAARAFEKERRSQARKELEDLKKTGTGPMTIENATSLYWEEVGQFHATREDTWRHLGTFVQFFGKTKRLDQITDADLCAMIAWKRQQPRWGRSVEKYGTVSNATVNRTIIEPLKRLMARAKRTWKLSLPREPNWSDHWLKQAEERVRELDDHEGKALDEAVRDDYAPWLEFARLTGLRRRETLLQWSNVNWRAKQITITGKGDRKVRTPITPTIEALLKSCMGHHPIFVFTYVAKRTANGKTKGTRYPITKEGAKTQWRRLRKRSGVEDFRFHDIRHDVASKLLRETGNLKLVQKSLNHKDIKSTLRYAHVLDGDVAAGLESVAKSRKKSRTKHKKSA